MKKLITNKEELAKELAELALSRKVVKELGEPIIFDTGDLFCVMKDHGRCIGFGAVNKKRNYLKYMYVKENYRGKGFFKEIYLELESKCIGQIRTVSTNSALPIYQKYGFEITKSFVNYHNLKKNLNGQNSEESN